MKSQKLTSRTPAGVVWHDKGPCLLEGHKKIHLLKNCVPYYHIVIKFNQNNPMIFMSVKGINRLKIVQYTGFFLKWKNDKIHVVQVYKIYFIVWMSISETFTKNCITYNVYLQWVSIDVHISKKKDNILLKNNMFLISEMGSI